MSGRRPFVPLAAGVAVPWLVGLAWFALSIATGLVFHFMPGATFLAAAWAYRTVGGLRPAPRTDSLLVLGGGGLVSAAGLLAIAQAGGAIAEPAELAVVLFVGVALTVRWLRRP